MIMPCNVDGFYHDQHDVVVLHHSSCHGLAIDAEPCAKCWKQANNKEMVAHETLWACGSSWRGKHTLSASGG